MQGVCTQVKRGWSLVYVGLEPVWHELSEEPIVIESEFNPLEAFSTHLAKFPSLLFWPIYQEYQG